MRMNIAHERHERKTSKDITHTMFYRRTGDVKSVSKAKIP